MAKRKRKHQVVNPVHPSVLQQLVFHGLWGTRVVTTLLSPATHITKKGAAALFLCLSLWLMVGCVVYISNRVSYERALAVRVQERQVLLIKQQQLKDVLEKYPTAKTVLIDYVNVSYQLGDTEEVQRALLTLQDNHPNDTEVMSVLEQFGDGKISKK